MERETAPSIPNGEEGRGVVVETMITEQGPNDGRLTVESRQMKCGVTRGEVPTGSQPGPVVLQKTEENKILVCSKQLGRGEKRGKESFERTD